jgi:hypothetical protein
MTSSARGGSGTENGLHVDYLPLVSDVIRTNEMQVWYASEHLVSTPLVEPE